MSKSELHVEIEDDNLGVSSSGSSTTPSLTTSSLPLVTPTFDSLLPTFQELKPRIEKSEAIPEIGPDYFNIRRKRWLTPTESVDDSKPYPRCDTKDCVARARLEKLVSGPEITDEVWAAGIDSVWNGLVSGGRLRRPLPLDIVIKVLKAGWHRDGTWPKGLVVPSSPPVLFPDESEPNIKENITLPEPVALPTPIPASAAVQERLSRIAGADGMGYLSDTSRARLEHALEKYDGNIDNLADEDILRIKYEGMVVLETKTGQKIEHSS